MFDFAIGLNRFEIEIDIVLKLFVLCICVEI